MPGDYFDWTPGYWDGVSWTYEPDLVDLEVPVISEELDDWDIAPLRPAHHGVLTEWDDWTDSSADWRIGELNLEVDGRVVPHAELKRDSDLPEHSQKYPARSISEKG